MRHEVQDGPVSDDWHDLTDPLNPVGISGVDWLALTVERTATCRNSPTGIALFAVAKWN
jgi:hypothetical protein